MKNLFYLVLIFILCSCSSDDPVEINKTDDWRNHKYLLATWIPSSVSYDYTGTEEEKEWYEKRNEEIIHKYGHYKLIVRTYVDDKKREKLSTVFRDMITNSTNMGCGIGTETGTPDDWDCAAVKNNYLYHMTMDESDPDFRKFKIIDKNTLYFEHTYGTITVKMFMKKE